MNESLHPVLSTLQEYVLRGWHAESESAVMAICIFITVCVTIVAVLMVCVSADSAGVFSVSIGGLLAAAGFTQRRCSRYAELEEPDLEPPAPDFEHLCRSRRGSSVVEFAFIYPVVLVALGGIFGLGEAFYTYNSLQSAARSAARYASLAPFDLPNGVQWKQEVRNMAVYGDPDPQPNASPLVPGLVIENVSANAYIPEGEPTIVTVAISDYEFDFVFFDFKVSQPVVKFPFLGRALIP